MTKRTPIRVHAQLALDIASMLENERDNPGELNTAGWQDIADTATRIASYARLQLHAHPQLHPDAPAVPPGMRPKPGVEYGCGLATCEQCYEPDTHE